MNSDTLGNPAGMNGRPFNYEIGKILIRKWQGNSGERKSSAAPVSWGGIPQGSCLPHNSFCSYGYIHF